MEKYPRLRDETERILTTFLREQEQQCKDHVSPLSYLTSNFAPLCVCVCVRVCAVEADGGDRASLHEHKPPRLHWL